MIKWFLGFKQKMKAVGLLFGAMVLILFTALSMRHALRDIDQTLTTVYADRLQPAVDLVYLSENLHAKRLMLDAYLTGQSKMAASALTAELNRYNGANQQLIGQFEHTKLTPREAQRLESFKASVTHYNDLERTVLHLSESSRAQEAAQLFTQQGATFFQQGVMALHDLAQIQVKTGQQAIEAAHQEASGGAVNATLLIAVSVLIGVLILAIIQSINLVPRPTHPFHLN
ncbi:hypothetical protein GCM10027341_50890 [Spirosoma knui]